MKKLVKRLWREEEGQDLTEYALLLFLITVALVSSVQGLATAITGVFTTTTGTLT